MDYRKKKLNIIQAKQLDLVNYLAGLDIHPVRQRGDDFWYLSPFRDEDTPSFKVNRAKKTWIDFGGTQRRGGTLIDFGIAYLDCSISELLDKLSTEFTIEKSTYPPQTATAQTESHIKILSEAPITSYALIGYLQKRGIDLDIARAYCKEVRFEIKNKTYYGIGFKNDSGGYEIRNPYMKSSSSPKTNTTINNGSKEVIVFEGFMDFLSYLTRNRQQLELPNFAVLNGTALFERARPFLESHQKVKLFLDRGKGGENCTAYAMNLSNIYQDESYLYKNHEDYNQWHTASTTVKTLRPRKNNRMK